MLVQDQLMRTESKIITSPTLLAVIHPQHADKSCPTSKQRRTVTNGSDHITVTVSQSDCNPRRSMRAPKIGYRSDATDSTLSSGYKLRITVVVAAQRDANNMAPGAIGPNVVYSVARTRGQWAVGGAIRSALRYYTDNAAIWRGEQQIGWKKRDGCLGYLRRSKWVVHVLIVSVLQGQNGSGKRGC